MRDILHRIGAYLGLTQLIASPKEKGYDTITIPAIVFLILYLFQPFGLSSMPEDEIFYRCLACAGISLFSEVIFVLIIPGCIPSLFRSDRWTMGRALSYSTLTTLFMGLMLCLYFTWMVGIPFSWYLLLITIKWALLVSVLLITFSLLWENNRSLKRHLREAQVMNEELASVKEAYKRNKENEANAVIEAATEIRTKTDFKEKAEAETGTETVQSVTRLLFAESNGNYVKFKYLDNPEGKTSQELQRATLRQVEQELAAYPYIIQCHRAYLVNMQQVKRVEGNSHGFKLLMNDGESEVPVSRSYITEVKRFINREA